MIPCKLALPDGFNLRFAELAKAAIAFGGKQPFKGLLSDFPLNPISLMKTKAGTGDRQTLIQINDVVSDEIMDLMKAQIRELFPDAKTIALSGAFYYPPGGCRGWHTNEDSPSRRVYFTYSDGDSYFCYENTEGEIVKDYDDPGVAARTFIIPELPGRFWHGVFSNCNRVSIGFRVRH